MISYHYLKNSKSQLYELFNCFTYKERIKGKDLLNELGEEYVNEWLEANDDEIRKYILSTPSERIKKQKWNSNFKYRFLIIYFSAIYIERGIILLQVLDEHQIRQNESYREMSLKACDIFSELHSYDCFFDTFFKERFKYLDEI